MENKKMAQRNPLLSNPDDDFYVGSPKSSSSFRSGSPLDSDADFFKAKMEAVRRSSSPTLFKPATTPTDDETSFASVTPTGAPTMRRKPDSPSDSD
jgi:hypothetical protein